MEILYVLIPLSVGLVAFALWSFVWSVNNRQFDDLERHGWSVLFDENQDKDIENTEDINP
jgi:cbb3-type cytochrome oxidase maturation protein